MTQPLPKISIITPSFNQAEFLEATIQSVLSQKYPNLEYIIIDGGSTDTSVEIIKKYESHLHFWCSEPDSGQYDAINKGFAKSTGEIMAWINSDDIYFPNAFKTVASIMSQLQQVEWLTSLNSLGWDWHGFCTGFNSVPGYSREAFLDGCYLPPITKAAIGWIPQDCTFWRRSLWERVGNHIRISYRLAGDFDLWSQFFTVADLYGTYSPLGGFRSQTNQRSRQMEQYVLEAEKSLTEVRDIFNWQPKFIKTRSMAFNLRLHKLPVIKEINKSNYSYLGKRVVRKDSDRPSGFWEIEQYQFC